MLSKLSYDKIWLRPQEKPKQSQTAIIFDWDDTILPTSILTPFEYLLANTELQMPSELKKRLDVLDKTASELLSKTKESGRVYIVTNAAEGWCEISAVRFLPKVYEELQSDITIISARTKYEKLYPRNYQKWKIEAFLETRADMEEEAVTNLIAIGDNNFEIQAAHILGKQFKKAFIKTIKFRHAPKFNELTKQLKLVDTKLEQIVSSAKNLTVRLLKTQEYKQACENDQNLAPSAQVDLKTTAAQSQYMAPTLD